MSPNFPGLLLSEDESLLKYTDLADHNIEFTLLRRVL